MKIYDMYDAFVCADKMNIHGVEFTVDKFGKFNAQVGNFNVMICREYNGEITMVAKYSEEYIFATVAGVALARKARKVMFKAGLFVEDSNRARAVCKIISNRDIRRLAHLFDMLRSKKMNKTLIASKKNFYFY